MRRRRDALGYSQEDYADLLGIHRTYLGALERGERNVSLRTVERLCQLAGLDPLRALARAPSTRARR